MPVIPKEKLEGGAILKPSKLNLRIGDRIACTITRGHEVNDKGLYSIPVDYVNGKARASGRFPLNQTHLVMLSKAVGDADTDHWVGYSFDVLVVPQNNPQTGQQVPAWSILSDTIRKQETIATV